MLWVVIAASLVSLGAIIYGALRARKVGDALGMVQIKRWRKDWVPITILLDDEAFLPDEIPKLHDAAKSAARFWNEQTGLKLFAAPTDVGLGATVPVMRHDPLTMEEHENAVAYAALTVGSKGTLVRAVVYMVNWENLPSLVLARAMKHEFGHCLGLAHDDIEYSVMYGKVSQRMYCVSPLDKEFLLEAYG